MKNKNKKLQEGKRSLAFKEKAFSSQNGVSTSRKDNT